MPVFSSYHSRPYFGLNWQTEPQRAEKAEGFVFRKSSAFVDEIEDTILYLQQTQVSSTDEPIVDNPSSVTIGGQTVVTYASVVWGDTDITEFANYDWF
ncbi:MAG: hypothetical protein AAF414_11675 [Pseudomonadota bacterium]